MILGVKRLSAVYLDTHTQTHILTHTRTRTCTHTDTLSPLHPHTHPHARGRLTVTLDLGRSRTSQKSACYSIYYVSNAHTTTCQTHIQGRRVIGCLKVQVMYRKRATNYGALLWKMTYRDEASYDSTPPCTTTCQSHIHIRVKRLVAADLDTWPCNGHSTSMDVTVIRPRWK